MAPVAAVTKASASVNGRRRGSTATSRFGVSRRESHDSSEFYDRFPMPTISQDDLVNLPTVRDRIWVGDARQMDQVGQITDGSVALVVTSPPYYAGKEYEAAIGEGHVPPSYIAYLEMLESVFAECWRKLEPGGRIAVNVANLGRKPFRSLSADVVGLLQNLRFLLRGEVVWVKGKAAGGSCAWGSFQRPGNPVLRDVTERIVVASKGRFDRAVGARERAATTLPSVATVSADEFMDLTTDVWELAPESATRVGHPAPFPVELPRRFIDLYTYQGDLVLDPFMGSGSTAVAAVRTGRSYVGFDTDPGYVAQAEARVREEQERIDNGNGRLSRPVHIPARAASEDDDVDPQQRAVRDGRKAKDLALLVLEDAGFQRIEKDVKLPNGLDINFQAFDRQGARWYFDVSGAFSSSRPGLRRPDALWKALGKASVLAATEVAARLIFLTTDLPAPNSPGARALRAVRGFEEGRTVADVIQLLEPDDLARLRPYAEGSETKERVAPEPRLAPRSKG